MNGPTRAMILAAGLGTRMRPLTHDTPKPLVKVAGRALIDHAIDRLVDAGVKTIVVNVHYFADKLRDHLAKRDNVEIRISDETDAILGTGGGIVRALPNFEGEPFFLHNSDSIWAEGYGRALERLKARWNSDTMDSLLLMAPLVTAMGYEGRGDFLMDAEGHLSSVPEGLLSPFAYPGAAIIHPRLFDDAPRGAFPLLQLWERAIEQKRLFGVRLDGVWMHVGTPDAVKEAETFLADLAPA
ncbi:MAG: nucleotidyltransferase family protein [Alphaproteobacteria bacterium]|nr:nucleotidyltransferase family protein [Alphaproteobacteria bacterium]